MKNTNDILFLCRKMKELREKNGLNQEEIAHKLNSTKSTISRVEAGKLHEKTVIQYANDYCRVFGLSEEQTEQFMRGDKIAVPDTSALLKNAQLIEELDEEYAKVIIPKIVIDELDKIKNKKAGALAKKAWEVLKGIGSGNRTIQMEYHGNANENKDCKIIRIAQEAANQLGCKVDIITEDIDYSAYLKGNENVTALHLREYMITKQPIVNMTLIGKLNECNSGCYDEFEGLSPEEVNAYLPDGNTLIISAIRNRKLSAKQKKNKIRWLISHGADINKRDCGRRYFPPISHAIQVKDFEIFIFLLKECNANPNIGSRNPRDSGKLRQKNEGNMPLMIAAWDGKDDFVKVLCDDKRTSINQQDANGFTALIKACANGNTRCRDILLEAGADKKIIDINEKTADDHYNEYLEFGALRSRFQNGNNSDGKKGKR